jgi:hypothetical protein
MMAAASRKPYADPGNVLVFVDALALDAPFLCVI